MPKSWTVLLPVRTGPGSKSRLAAPPGLADAFVHDCVAAVAACPGVTPLVVLSGATIELPARVIAAPAPGLAIAIDFGLARLQPDQWAAVLLPDRPSLRVEDLAAVLASVEETCFVPDCLGSGTALLAGQVGALNPQFGRHSAARHRAVGARELAVASPRLRCDVDTPADLFSAWQLGVGRATSARLSPVQVTVLSFDQDLGNGDVVTDDGLRLPLPAQALVGSELRFLRPGQRLTCLVSPDESGAPVVVAARIRGIGEPLPE